MRAWRSVVGCFGLVSVACAEHAPRPDAFHEPSVRPTIYGGELVATCAWPMTVQVEGCSGTLVHPEIVLLAAHCVPLGPTRVIFGDDYTKPELEVAITSCTAHPSSSELGNDIGFCRLAEPVENLPIVPLLAGCETAALELGKEVVAVGFGEADDTLGAGPKRAVNMPIVSLSERDAEIGGGGKDTCTGDSGGPVFIRLEDDTWRLFAVTSYGNACGQGGHYSLLHPALDWLENAAGVDLTPCHDGPSWAPSAGCGAFPLQPDLGGASWAQRCATEDVSELGSTCGAPFDPDAPAEPNGLEPGGGCALQPRADIRGWLLQLLAVAAALALRRRR